MFGAQILAEVGSIDTLADSILLSASDPGSLNVYADGLRIHMRGIFGGLGLTRVESIVFGDAVHLDIPQSSVG